MKDQECRAETWSWEHFNDQQVDPYWIRCTLMGYHEIHEDECTGLTWRATAEEEAQMPLHVRKYIRKPLSFDAVQVTKDNMEEVALWCGGQVITTFNTARHYVEVPVVNATKLHQTKAYEHFYVVKGHHSWRVYTPKSFETNFMAKVEIHEDHNYGEVLDRDS